MYPRNFNGQSTLRRLLTICKIATFAFYILLSAIGADAQVKSGQTETAAKQAAVSAESSTSPAKTKEEIITELRAQLGKAKTGTDSIPILFNLFDLSAGKVQTEYGFQLFRTARRAGNEEIALDVLRNVANYNMRNDSILQITERLAKEFQPSEDQKHTLTFIRIQRNVCADYFADPAMRTSRLQELLRQTTVNPPKDLYDKIVVLHSLCVNLSNISEGELLAEKLTELGKLIEEIPSSDKALRNSFYVWSSMIYTKTHQHELAIDASQKLLDLMDALDERNQRIGRKYRDYGANRYVVYTRLLENYEKLSPAEIEKYYKLAMEEVANNAQAELTYKRAPLPSIFYAYSKGDYQQAFNLIENCKDAAYLIPRRLQIMRMYIDAAERTHNNGALLQAYPEYVNMLEENMDTKQAERFRELQVIYEVNEMKTQNENLQEQSHESRNRTLHTYIIICAIVVIILLIFVLILWRINHRNRQLASKLKLANEALNKESKSLREARVELETARDNARNADALKTDFITNMSHEVTVPLQAIQEYATMIVENADDSKKKYISTFADRLAFNCELVNTIINDVLQLSELSNSTLKIKEKPYDIQPICETAIDAVAPRVADGVTLKMRPEDSGTDLPAVDDFVLLTDRHRLIQILVNLLSNAAKFTTDGEIVLTYGRSSDRTQAIFTVTDTGKGIDPRYQHLIFDRFTKLDNTVPGAGLGLTISRMLAELLGGSLILDSAYTLGARFILTLPFRR